MIVFQILIVVGVLYGVYRLHKLGKFTKKPNQPSVPTNTAFFPCILEGNIDMPPMADVIKAARIDVEEAKAYLTSVGKYRDNLSDDECMALCSMPVQGHPNWDGVNTFGGGGSFGGRYLVGSYHFEIDTNGQQIPNASWIKLFSDDKYEVTGGITGDGTIAMGSIGGVGISGSVVSGVPTGKVLHGDGKHHIYGVITGTYRKV